MVLIPIRSKTPTTTRRRICGSAAFVDLYGDAKRCATCLLYLLAKFVVDFWFVLFRFVLCVEIPEPAPTRHSLLPERRHSLPPYSPPSKELKLPERSADVQTVSYPTSESESVLDTTKPRVRRTSLPRMLPLDTLGGGRDLGIVVDEAFGVIRG